MGRVLETTHSLILVQRENTLYVQREKVQRENARLVKKRALTNPSPRGFRPRPADTL